MTEILAPHVFTAVTEVMRAMAVEGIGKDKVNQMQKYKFRGIDDVYNALSTHMARVGLIIVPSYSDRVVIERKTKEGGNLFYVTLQGSFSLYSSVDGSVFPVSVQTFGEAMDSSDKATNKAMSAAFKYAAMQLFCIPTEGDNDADFTTHVVLPTGETVENAGAVATKNAKEDRAFYTKMETMVRQAPDQDELTALWRAHAAEIRASKWNKDITNLFSDRKTELQTEEVNQEEEIND